MMDPDRRLPGWIWGGEKLGGLQAGVYALALNLAICFVGMAIRGKTPTSQPFGWEGVGRGRRLPS